MSVNSIEKNDELEKVIDKNLKKIKRTRKNRIILSERLKKYSHRWRIITFVLNMEAVFLVIWSLSSKSDTNLISSFFAIYVILLQYLINELNYNERSMKAHYHQLELNELLVKLSMLKVKIKKDLSFDESIKKIEKVMEIYQVSLKNNENHSNRDDRVGKMNKYVPNHKLYDFSLDNIFIFLNLIICIIFFGYIFYLIMKGEII